MALPIPDPCFLERVSKYNSFVLSSIEKKYRRDISTDLKRACAFTLVAQTKWHRIEPHLRKLISCALTTMSRK